MKRISDDTLLRSSLLLPWLIWGNTQGLIMPTDTITSVAILSETTFIPQPLHILDDRTITTIIQAFICFTLLTGYFFPIASVIGCTLAILSSVEASLQLFTMHDDVMAGLLKGEWVLLTAGAMLLRRDLQRVKRESSLHHT
jgi:hypothetical protein